MTQKCRRTVTVDNIWKNKGGTDQRHILTSWCAASELLEADLGLRTFDMLRGSSPNLQRTQGSWWECGWNTVPCSDSNAAGSDQTLLDLNRSIIYYFSISVVWFSYVANVNLVFQNLFIFIYFFNKLNDYLFLYVLRESSSGSCNILNLVMFIYLLIIALQCFLFFDVLLLLCAVSLNALKDAFKKILEMVLLLYRKQAYIPQRRVFSLKIQVCIRAEVQVHASDFEKWFTHTGVHILGMLL